MPAGAVRSRAWIHCDSGKPPRGPDPSEIQTPRIKSCPGVESRSSQGRPGHRGRCCRRTLRNGRRKDSRRHAHTAPVDHVWRGGSGHRLPTRSGRTLAMIPIAQAALDVKRMGVDLSQLSGDAAIAAEAASARCWSRAERSGLHRNRFSRIAVSKSIVRNACSHFGDDCGRSARSESWRRPLTGMRRARGFLLPDPPPHAGEGATAALLRQQWHSSRCSRLLGLARARPNLRSDRDGARRGVRNGTAARPWDRCCCAGESRRPIRHSLA
jgi:hypothetical protein